MLLVVAADDGLMPQTREHLAIVELLGIRRALVALTKIDRVEPQRVQQVRTQVEHLLASGPLARSPIFPLSSSTGEGVEALREALGGLAGEVRERSREGYFRLAVDRAFSVAGSGIVVTGTAFSGQVAVGDELLLGNAGRPVRVRGLHAQNRPAQQAWAGQRVALNIAGERLALEQIQRGDWLLQAALHAPTTRSTSTSACCPTNSATSPTGPRCTCTWAPRTSPGAWPCSKANNWSLATAPSPNWC